MDENEDNFVMADPVSPQSYGAISSKISWKLIAFCLALIIGLLGLAYFVLSKNVTSPQPISSNSPTSNQTNNTHNPPITSSTSSPESKLKPSIISQHLVARLNLNFAYNNADISSSEINKIKVFWSKVSRSKGKIIIQGHADSQGKEAYNYKLSYNRAKKVAEILKTIGIDNKHEVTIQAFGETKPIADNKTEKGKALNRRAIINFVENK